MNILFTCAGRRHYLLQFFKEVLGDNGRIIGADMQLSAPALVLADKAIAVPGVYAENYIDALIQICKDEHVDAIISLNDLELPILASARERFEACGAKLIVSSDEVIDICFDKWKTFDFAKAHGFDTPKTYLSVEAVKEAIKAGEVNYPLVVKPRWGSASVGIDFPDNEEELELSYRLQRLKLKNTILGEVSGQDIENAIIIQEKIKGKEFGVDILNDLNGKPRVVYVKEKLAMRAGETDKAVLRDIPGLEAAGFRLGEALGHIGNLDCDFFVKDDKFYLLELNPRFGGGYPFSQMAGANFPAAIIKWLKGEEQDLSAPVKRYDEFFAKCDTLISVASN